MSHYVSVQLFKQTNMPLSRIPLDHYLKTSYRPDREYIDGELRERNLGLYSHARSLAILAAWLGKYEASWQHIGLISPRISISSARVRVPDLALLYANRVEAPPILVVEILSPQDTFTDTQERVADYHGIGVETVWLIDPTTGTGRICQENTWRASDRLVVPSTPIYADLPTLLQRLNNLPSNLSIN
jgi:Uma2 family endonuclease